MADRQQVEYQGVIYDMPAGLSNEEYLGKIQAHLGQTPEPATQPATPESTPAPAAVKEPMPEDFVGTPLQDTIEDLPNLAGGLIANAAKKFYNSPSKFFMTNLARPSAAATTGAKRAIEGEDVMEGVRQAWNNPETQEFMSDVAMDKMVEKGVPVPLAAGMATAGQLAELVAFDPLNVTGAGLGKSLAKLNQTRRAMEVGGAQGQAAMRESAKVADQQIQQILEMGAEQQIQQLQAPTPRPDRPFLTKLGREMVEGMARNPDDVMDLAADAKLSRLDGPGLEKTKAKAGEKIAEKMSEGVSEPLAKMQVADELNLPKTTVYDTLNKEATSTRGFMGIKTAFTPMSSRVRQGAPKLWWRERVTDTDTAVLKSRLTHIVKPLQTQYRKMKKPERDRFEKAMKNRNWEPIQDIFTNRPKLKAALDDVRVMLDDLGALQKEAGYEFKTLDNYMPIRVKDLDGLLKAEGKGGAGGRLGAMVRSEELKRIKAGKPPMTGTEKAKLFRDATTHDLGTALGKPGHLKERTKQNYKDSEMKFVDDTISSLRDYIDDAVTNLQKQKMFGGKYGDELNDESIGRLIQEELEAGHMTPEVISESADLLRTRYVSGEAPGNRFINAMKNSIYLQTLGQHTSGLRQLGDIGLAMQREGVFNTIGAVGDVLMKRGLTREMVGVDNITREIGKQGYLGSTVDKVFTANGMKVIDGFGKNVRLNAAVRHFKKQAKSRRGRERIGAEFQGAMPQEEFVKLMQDLDAGKSWHNSDQIKQVATSRLFDAQPLSTMEMPEQWAKNPNGRILYSLLSFTLKTFDNTMLEARLSMRSGQSVRNKVRGARTLMAGAAWLAMANYPADKIIDYVRGRDQKLTSLDVAWSMLQLIGVSKFTKDNAEKGRVAEAIPFIGWLNKNGKNVYQFAEALMDEDKDVDWNRMVGGTPLLRVFYDHQLGGAEKFREWQEKQDD